MLEFLLSILKETIFANFLSAFEAYYWYFTFVEETFFREIKMADWFKMASFLGKVWSPQT
jgi:hypothetical protein